MAGPWYYEWSCAGACAPGRLTIEGREGPFLSRADCDYARDHDLRADEFVGPGNLGGLNFCYEDTSVTTTPGTTVTVSPGPATRPPRRSEIEIGFALGPAWSATSETATTRGSMTVGIEADSHYGRDAGGATVQLGFFATRLEAPLLGAEPRSLFIVPLSIGLALTPKVAGGATWSVRPDLGASVGGFFQLGCSGCPGAVFDETLIFGYTLKAGVDVYLSRDSGVSLDLIMPRWQLGTATPGNLLLESPTWMLRLSAINRPAL